MKQYASIIDNKAQRYEKKAISLKRVPRRDAIAKFGIAEHEPQANDGTEIRVGQKRKATVELVRADMSYTYLTDALIQFGFTIESLGENSWLAVHKNFLQPLPHEFDEVWNSHPKEFVTIKMFGKDVPIPRYQQAYGRSYAYSGGVSASIPPHHL